MKKISFALFVLFVFATAFSWAQCVLGVEANGSDEATMKAFEWRQANVYDKVYAKQGFKVILISQSSKAKVEEALDKNANITHITGCGHGNVNVYTGYNQTTVFSGSNTTLLKKLAGKHIHLLSCLTAQQLGPAMVKNGAASYAGYHPSFYFTWKSTHRFFDADAELDRAFADGMNAPASYKRTIDKFNQILKILETEEPDAVQYIVTDRDGLRCLPASARDEMDFTLPLALAKRTLYAKDMASGQFLSYAEACNNTSRAAGYSEMSAKEFKEMVIAKLEKMDRDFELCILSQGRFHRDRLIDEVRRETELGNSMLTLEKSFLQIVADSRWSKTITVKSDANGDIVTTDKFDVPMAITTKQVKATWQGQPNSFTSVSFLLNNESMFEGAVVNGQSYTIKKKVPSGPCQYSLKAAGGPKNTDVTVTLYFDLGK